jgi:mono/diheme cytochrome c family protein
MALEMQGDKPVLGTSRIVTVISTLVIAGVTVGLIGFVVVLSGAYNIAADVPHTGPIASVLQAVRTRAIQVRAKSIIVPPNLNDPERIAAGASEYAEMCSQCHLAPGMEKTEISQGLYPAAPEFARGDPLSPAEQFWVVEHGIKFTSMPAWGPTHPDGLLWDIVAFVRKLPMLSAAQYKSMTAQASEKHENMMKDMSGMADHHDDNSHH